MTSPNPREKGVALLSVLALIAAMAAAAIIGLDALSRTVAISKAGSGRSQAAWYMASAEALAVSMLKEVVTQTDGEINPTTPDVRAPIVINLPGGSIRAEISDASNCFNLNAIARKNEGNGYGIDDAAAMRLKTLILEMEAYSLDAHALVDTLADWIDIDTNPSARGVEDGYYVSLTPPYRTAGTLLSSPAELRAIAGFTREARETLAPFICVRPSTAQSALNINTLTHDDALLLTALFSEALDVPAARNLLDQRPVGGWSSVEEFLGEDAITTIRQDQRADEILSVSSNYFDLTGEVYVGTEVFPFHILLMVEEEGRVEIVSRRFGGD